MQRVNRSSAVPTLPAAPAGGTPGYFSGGNPAEGQPPTVPGYEWFNSVQEELMTVILRGQMTPNAGDLAQVSKSLSRQFGGNFRDINANTALTVDDTGVVRVNANIGSFNITLPPANSFPFAIMRFLFTRVDANPHTVTILPAPGDLIEFAPSVVLQSLNYGGSSVFELWADGGGNWFSPRPLPASENKSGVSRFASAAETDAGQISGVGVTPASLGIATRNYANPGYARLPGGLIFQWGVTNQNNVPGSWAATFPIAFPNVALHLSASARANGGSGGYSIVDQSMTLTGCTFEINEWGAFPQTVSVAYLAIGR
jgi:hypothetical protein